LIFPSIIFFCHLFDNAAVLWLYTNNETIVKIHINKVTIKRTCQSTLHWALMTIHCSCPTFASIDAFIRSA